MRPPLDDNSNNANDSSAEAPRTKFQMMTPKVRLRRLLGGKSSSSSRFRSGSMNLKKKAVSSVSSVTATTACLSYEDDVSSDGNNSLLDHDDVHQDVYRDVRERLEERAARDRAQNVFGEPSQQKKVHLEANIPAFVAYTTYLAYATFIFVGHLRDLFAWIFQRGRFLRKAGVYPSDDQSWYAPLLKSWEHFYTRRLYTRVQDAFNRPIGSNPGATIEVLERVSDDSQKSMKVLGSPDHLDSPAQIESYQSSPHHVVGPDGSARRRCINLGSYNYLGFADDWHATCADDVQGSLKNYGVSIASTRTELGTTHLHKQVEETVARFVGKPAALCFNMGFNTNATTIPALVGRGDLIISDALNHTSIVNGARSSYAAIRIFKHNDVQHLEEILKEAIVMGRPRTRRPWRKILVIVEGIYSMEGEYCDLRNVVRVCKQYGAYVYLDEAHSIGAMGPTGRGCAEYCEVDPKDIDIMMGTFTKSFGAMGGYICASKSIIAHLRKNCVGPFQHNAISPIVCQQVLTAFKVRVVTTAS